MEICSLGCLGLPPTHTSVRLYENLSLRLFSSPVTRVSLGFRACLCTKNEAPERGRSGNVKSKRATVGYKIPCKNMVNHQQGIDPRYAYVLHV